MQRNLCKLKKQFDKFIINLSSRNPVHRFGIQWESEFSVQIFLTEIGI